MHLSATLLLDTACIADFRIAEAHNQAHIVVLGDVQHLPCGRGKFIQYLGTITHYRCFQSVRITKQFKVGGSDMAVHLAVLCPFSDALLVGDKEMRRTAEQQVVLSQTLLGLLHLFVVEIAETVRIDMP